MTKRVKPNHADIHTLANIVRDELGIKSHREALIYVNATIDALFQAIVENDTVRISKLGTFNQKHYKSRKGYSPVHSGLFNLEPRTLIKFTMSSKLKRDVYNNSKGSQDESDTISTSKETEDEAEPLAQPKTKSKK